MYSKYERRTDTRTYEDRKKLYEGGWEILYCEILEKDWKEKMEEFGKHARGKLLDLLQKKYRIIVYFCS